MTSSVAQLANRSRRTSPLPLELAGSSRFSVYLGVAHRSFDSVNSFYRLKSHSCDSLSHLVSFGFELLYCYCLINNCFTDYHLFARYLPSLPEMIQVFRMYFFGGTLSEPKFTHCHVYFVVESPNQCCPQANCSTSHRLAQKESGCTALANQLARCSKG